jgi:hypothetical protein
LRLRGSRKAADEVDQQDLSAMLTTPSGPNNDDGWIDITYGYASGFHQPAESIDLGFVAADDAIHRSPDMGQVAADTAI